VGEEEAETCLHEQPVRGEADQFPTTISLVSSPHPPLSAFPGFHHQLITPAVDPFSPVPTNTKPTRLNNTPHHILFRHCPGEFLDPVPQLRT
jgi:hypothetical protein